MTNITNIVEDYLCDLCDAELGLIDGVGCDKVFNPELANNRAAFVTQIAGPVDDQKDIRKYTAQILEHRSRRTDCINDVDIIRRKFTKNGENLENGLAIYIDIQYITSPIIQTIETQTAYMVSAVLNIIVK